MNRRNFLKMLAPVAAVAPTYFFAPPEGWCPQPFVFGGEHPFLSIDYGKEASYSVYWLKRDGTIYTFDGERAAEVFQARQQRLFMRGYQLLSSGTNERMEEQWT